MIMNMKNNALRFTVAALALLLLCGAAFAGAAAADSIDIGSADEWNDFADKVNGGSSSSYYNVDINITNSFSFKDRPVTILGNYSLSKYYSGKIEGNGFTISDYVIDGGSGQRVGLVGEYKGSSIKNLTISNFSVHSGDKYVGGLVGRAGSASSFENVHAQFGNVMSGRDHVGGLVGNAYTAITFAHCSAAGCVVASSGSSNVGGLVGYANSASCFTDCDAADCSISGSNIVGGLVGYSTSANLPYFMDGCTVTNCIISAGSNNVGGLIGIAYYAAGSGIADCTVASCTVASSGGNYVGGLVGRAYATRCNFTGGGNWVNSSAVRGNASSVGNVVGSDKGTVKNTAPGVDQSGIIYKVNSTTGYPQVIIAKSANPAKQGPEMPDYFNSTAVSEVPEDAVSITVLDGYGPYGQYTAYGYYLESLPATKYTITNVSSAPLIGYTEVNVTKAKAGNGVKAEAFVTETGYHFVNWTCVNVTPSDDTINPYIFTMPAMNVKLTANFGGNVTNVKFYNQSELFDAKLNTYSDAVNTTSSLPTRAGYTFSGWNVSLGGSSWAPFDGTGYNESGTWKHAGENGGTLDVYANWTLIPTYEITNVTVNGTVIANQTSSAAGKTIHVDASADPGYHFVNWNVTTSSGVQLSVDGFGNFIMPAEAVNAGAEFAISQPQHSSSRNDGYSVWLQETAQPTPTPVPTAEPTQAVPVASPVAQPTQTSASPAPFAGILAGLGAAAVFFGMRRK